MVEAVFRDLKSILETRPIYHRHDETVRGYVSCSSVALILLIKEPLKCMENHDCGDIKWDRLKDDLDMLQRLSVNSSGKTFLMRTKDLSVNKSCLSHLIFAHSYMFLNHELLKIARYSCGFVQSEQKTLNQT